ncbi:hypothetical protein QR680_012999 [Steinernema hermaphroditum]|uniref:Uncharacterized protein n=1 Tax=Steinernema hermaphroditum TaxID=289476 RepID=A0AA39M1K3_9BILA|nr:hypothetical protein QR680_012999 [Steinernema hermaphroditum]
MSEHIKAQWASSPEYSTHKETDLYTPEANSVSSSCSSLDSQESSLSVMLETLACDGPCRQLMELKILKSFDCGHVFCETCLLEAIAKEFKWNGFLVIIFVFLRYNNRHIQSAFSYRILRNVDDVELLFLLHNLLLLGFDRLLQFHLRIVSQPLNNIISVRF